MQIKAFSGRFEAVEAILGTFPFSKMFPSRKFFEISPSIAILRGISKNVIRIILAAFLEEICPRLKMNFQKSSKARVYGPAAFSKYFICASGQKLDQGGSLKGFFRKKSGHEKIQI